MYFGDGWVGQGFEAALLHSKLFAAYWQPHKGTPPKMGDWSVNTLTPLPLSFFMAPSHYLKGQVFKLVLAADALEF